MGTIESWFDRTPEAPGSRDTLILGDPAISGQARSPKNSVSHQIIRRR
jgi:hypothetical protein